MSYWRQVWLPENEPEHTQALPYAGPRKASYEPPPPPAVEGDDVKVEDDAADS